MIQQEAQDTGSSMKPITIEKQPEINAKVFFTLSHTDQSSSYFTGSQFSVNFNIRIHTLQKRIVGSTQRSKGK